MRTTMIVLILIALIISGCSAPAAAPLPAGPVQAAPAVLASPTAVPTTLALPVAATQTAPTPTPAAKASANDECHVPYYPVVNGAWWKYEISTGSSATHTMTVSPEKVFTTTVQDKENTFKLKGLCTDDGITLMDVPGISGSLDSSDGSGSTLTTDSVDGVTVPSDIQVGDDWTQTMGITGKAGGTISLTATIETTYKAVGFESVTVPAGTFYALKVEQTGSMKMGPGKPFETHGFIWYAQDVGVVKSGLDGVYTSSLVAYAIP